MNRSEIKNLAKEKIKGNMWNIWWPYLIIFFLYVLIYIEPIPVNSELVNNTSSINLSTTKYLINIILTILLGIISGGYYKYILDFVRTGKLEAKTIIETIKKKWLDLLIAFILVYIIVYFCTLLFIIPGIIMSIAYSMTSYLIIDKNIQGSDSLATSRKMMKGYKCDYFVFILSFLGWVIVSIFTAGILLIWLIPYMLVATVIYYDKLQEKTKIEG